MTGGSRDWYRHWKTGDRGYRETRDGVEVIVLDRPNEDITRPFRKTEWRSDREARPLNRMAIAQVAQTADATLCRVMGNPLKRPNWIDLSDKQRIAWMKEGPTKSFPRRTLYEFVMWAVEWLAESEEPPPKVEALRKMVEVVREYSEWEGDGVQIGVDRAYEAMSELESLLFGDEDAEQG